MYRAFYNIIRAGEYVDSDDSISITLLEVFEELLPKIKEDKEYLGLIDSKDTTLQFMYEAESDQFWTEIPNPEKNGSYGRNIEYEDMHEFLRDLPEVFPTEGFGGFKFQPWAASDA